MRSVRLDANLGTGFDSCTDVQVCGAMLDADLGTDLKQSALGSMLDATRWNWYQELVSIDIKKGRHTRCLPVD